ncbi:MAG: hypothetical protein GXP63_01450, partial [DPANN group archaeon]|nr:hypothetical protein [DPANN group archaeon]
MKLIFFILFLLVLPAVSAVVLEYHDAYGVTFYINRSFAPSLNDRQNIFVISTNENRSILHISCYDAEWLDGWPSCAFWTKNISFLPSEINVTFHLYKNLNPTRYEWVECHASNTVDLSCFNGDPLINITPDISHSVSIPVSRDEPLLYAVLFNETGMMLSPLSERPFESRTSSKAGYWFLAFLLIFLILAGIIIT